MNVDCTPLVGRRRSCVPRLQHTAASPLRRNVQNIVVARSISTNLELIRPGVHTRLYIHAYARHDIDVIYSIMHAYSRSQ